MPGFVVVDLDGPSAAVRILDTNDEPSGAPTVL
jgi:hypothetical protein